MHNYMTYNTLLVCIHTSIVLYIRVSSINQIISKTTDSAQTWFYFYKLKLKFAKNIVCFAGKIKCQLETSGSN